MDDVDIHDWYRFVYAYSDRLVTGLADEFGIGEDDLVVDPFNGTGTTTLTAKKLGIDSIGTDTSPASVLSARCKTNWDVDLDAFRERRSELLRTIRPVFDEISSQGNTTLDSFGESGGTDVDLSTYDFSEPEKTPKGWLSEKPLQKMTVLKYHVEELPDDDVTDLFELAMIAVLPEDVGNVRFGPEATRDRTQEGDTDVFRFFKNKLADIEADLERVQAAVESGEIEPGDTEILRADARQLADVLRDESELLNADAHDGEVDYVITSPPYPAEHDYTRNQRLELIWLDAADDNEDLQRIKKANIRSHTKNIYVADDEGEQVDIRANDRVDAIVSEMETILEEEDISHGFGKYYPRVITEYFAGMQHHFEQVYDVLAPGGKAAYVVGDSGSYWQVEVETAEILAELAENRVGFEAPEIRLWRNMAATTADYDDVEENILVLTKPDE
ncbi:DNA modification methylase [Halarchaeum rubridurum]|uniref:site-specific DNA-methyltransferase (cytosine-N(4)-specific) n=1 Tax=Halarchaeum rubridurum TaxID=489911 RepID=A0A8T4GKD9_9EURY|nr:DNA methyltransferase [Halarchaeum rubridurum]MBP1954076.1 DNA modification methylase [Halarchaeum rubridurum]